MRPWTRRFIGLLIALHVGFFVLEAVAWDWNIAAGVRRQLGFTTTDAAEIDSVGTVAKNQGFSNLFLAAGLAWGLSNTRRRPVLDFSLVCIAVAGVVGYLSLWPLDLFPALMFLVGQTVLAVLVIARLHHEDLAPAPAHAARAVKRSERPTRIIPPHERVAP
jgi:uncharacterized membrane protein